MVCYFLNKIVLLIGIYILRLSVIIYYLISLVLFVFVEYFKICYYCFVVYNLM